MRHKANRAVLTVAARIGLLLGMTAASLILAACQGVPPLSPAYHSDRSLVATQWLQLRSQQQTLDAICLLEITPSTMKLVATTPQGQTLLTSVLDERKPLKTTLAPWLAQTGINAEHIARDVQLALWPANALIQEGWQVQESLDGTHRIVHLHGQKWAEISYEGGQRKPNRIIIERGENLYTVELRTLEWTSP